MSAQIHIATAPKATFCDAYVINVLSKVWRDQGYKVSIGAVDRLIADINLFHVDQTWIKQDQLPKNPDNRMLLNGGVRDISKRSFSELILKRDSNYDGPVIVKTDANSGGEPELRSSRWGFLKKGRRKLAKLISWTLIHDIPRGRYPIIDSVEQVPEWVWDRKDLIIEKLVTEKEGDYFVSRQWIFFGKREYCEKVFEKHPIVRGQYAVSREWQKDIKDDISNLREIRKRLGIAFGKFDYVIKNGKAVLHDINKTPTRTKGYHYSEGPEATFLSAGIRDYL